MHPFPSPADLQFLVGKALENISLRFWSFGFGFGGNVSITVEGDVQHIGADGTLRQHNTDEDRLSPLMIHHLIGQTVRLLDVEPYCLTLTFDQGDRLRIPSDDGPFECGQIYDEAGRLKVF
ncbi:hypothetical protein [Novosphingobium olei]|uniref:hypothetical protein n=1 Tax=Novosphingobium olei TaxID=2728851 RepID=UPI00308496C8|nr:hypothetical protein NSDW_21080 [Novosphingobium olei]